MLSTGLSCRWHTGSRSGNLYHPAVTFQVDDSSRVVLDRLVGHVEDGTGMAVDGDGPLSAEVGQSVVITALPSPMGMMFEPGEPAGRPKWNSSNSCERSTE